MFTAHCLVSVYKSNSGVDRAPSTIPTKMATNNQKRGDGADTSGLITATNQILRHDEHPRSPFIAVKTKEEEHALIPKEPTNQTPNDTSDTLKLIIACTDFLVRNGAAPGDKVVFAGGTTCSHMNILTRMFPGLSFQVYDGDRMSDKMRALVPRKFSNPIPKHPGCEHIQRPFSDEDIDSYVESGLNKKLYFISDERFNKKMLFSRSENKKQMMDMFSSRSQKQRAKEGSSSSESSSSSSDDENEDNETSQPTLSPQIIKLYMHHQMQQLNRLKPKAAMLRLRFPYSGSSTKSGSEGDETVEFLSGKMYVPCFTKKFSTEVYLDVCGSDEDNGNRKRTRHADPYETTIYDAKAHEEAMFHHNITTRIRHITEYVKGTPRQLSIDQQMAHKVLDRWLNASRALQPQRVLSDASITSIAVDLDRCYTSLLSLKYSDSFRSMLNKEQKKEKKGILFGNHAE